MVAHLKKDNIDIKFITFHIFAFVIPTWTDKFEMDSSSSYIRNKHNISNIS